MIASEGNPGGFRPPMCPSVRPFLAGANITNRQIDPTAANLIAVSDKVLEVARGEIPLPEVVELWLTNYCDFACPHCRCARFHGGPNEFMDDAVLERLINELSDRGVKRLEISGGGEPLQHPRALEIFQKLSARGFRVGLITNGYALAGNRPLSDALVGCCDWIRFSLDAISEEAFQTVHGRSDLSYRQLRTAILALTAGASARSDARHRPHIGVKFIIQRVNRHEMPSAIDEVRELGADYVQFKFLEDHPWALQEEREALAEEILQRARALPGGALDVDILPGYGGERLTGRCVMSVLHPVIDWDGEIYLCAFFNHRRAAHSVGNLRDAPFFTCWGTAHHREQLANVDPRQCVANCPLKRYNPVIEFIVREHFRFHYI